LGLVLFLLLMLAARGTLFPGPLQGNFYAVFGHKQLALLFGTAFGFAVLALALGVTRFWREVAPPGFAAGAQQGDGAVVGRNFWHLDLGLTLGSNMIVA
jgi:citrate/tricarballylate utilization protein